MAPVRESELNSWGKILNDPQAALVERFRALWGLKHAKEELAIDLISKAFNSKSELLKHELAYCLGQKKNAYSIAQLIKVLEDENQESIVRHEAGEALAAIGDLSVIDLLKTYSHCSDVAVAETCYLGYKRLSWVVDGKENIPENQFDTVDPAPEFQIGEKTMCELKDILHNPNEDLFLRYRAMFSLRRIAHSVSNESAAALNAICSGLFCNSSALYRHEIAFVLGQLADPLSINDLRRSLANIDEIGMVRHESAEALGAIGTEESMSILNEFLQDKQQVVSESCVIALDLAEYNMSENFQYALVPSLQ